MSRKMKLTQNEKLDILGSIIAQEHKRIEELLENYVQLVLNFEKLRQEILED